MDVSRNTVRKYLRESEPVRRESGSRARPALEAVAERIDELLEAWSRRTSAKQRVTGSRIHRQLLDEGYQVGVTTVRAYLREKRRQASEMFIPLVHRAGDAAQVDFFEVTVVEGGEMCKAWKLLVRLMYSGRDFVWLYDRCDQVAFLDGHVRAFAAFGGVPRRMVYDNLSAAVKRRVGVQRELTDRFQALVSHYLFEPCFARPGEGHDKGGVESRGKGIRLQHMTPIPEGESLAAISRQVLCSVEKAAARERKADGRTVEERFCEEIEVLGPLPAVPFEARKMVPVTISRQGMIQVDGASYTLPSRWRSLRGKAFVGIDDILVECCSERETVARQRPGGRLIQYRHCLEELAKKPQAVRQVAPELVAELGEPYGQLWKLLCARHGEREASRVLARIIGAVVDSDEQVVTDALEAAIAGGDVGHLLLARPPERARPVIAVPEALAGYEIESAHASDYDLDQEEAA
jgi:transposase